METDFENNKIGQYEFYETPPYTEGIESFLFRGTHLARLMVGEVRNSADKRILELGDKEEDRGSYVIINSHVDIIPWNDDTLLRVAHWDEDERVETLELLQEVFR